MSGDDPTLNLKGLDSIIKALMAKPPTIRIGILGDHAARSDGKGVSNAEVGTAHEFGTTKLPQRSFLRIPLETEFPKRLGDGNGLDAETLAAIIKAKSLMPWADKMGVLAISVVLDAFDSGGFGQWRPSDMTKKKNQQTLVETNQLRDSVTFDVVL